MQVYTTGGTVTLVLQVTNTTDAPLELNFPSGQSYDFVVRQGDQEIWRWSDGQMFTQSLRTERLAAGETLSYQESWPAPSSARGELVAIGTLVATDHPIEQAGRFSLP